VNAFWALVKALADLNAQAGGPGIVKGGIWWRLLTVTEGWDSILSSPDQLYVPHSGFVSDLLRNPEWSMYN
jgi:hypothetical protein